MQAKVEGTEELAAEYGAKTTKTATFILIAKLFTFMTTGLSLVVVARLLGSSAFGAYTLAIATASLFGALSSLGFDVTIVKFVSERMHRGDKAGVRSVIVNVFAILLLETGAAALLAILASGYIATNVYNNPLYGNLLRVAALTIVFGSLWGTASAVLIALGKGKSFTRNVFVQSIVQSAGSVLLAVAGIGALAPLFGLLAGQIVGVAIAAYTITRELGIKPSDAVVSPKKWRELLAFTLPIGLSGTVMGFLGSLTVMMLGYFATAAVVGNYGVTSKVSGIFDVAIVSIGTALLPLFSAVLASKKGAKNIGKYYNYALYFSFLFTAPVVFYVIGLAQQVAITIFSSAYTLAPLYFAVMAFGVLVNIPAVYVINLLISMGKSQKVMKYNLITAAVQLLLIPVLIPILSGLGASLLNFIIIPLVQIMLYGRRAYRIFKIKPDFNILGRVLGAGIISALAIVPLRYYFGGYYIPLLVVAAMEQAILYPIVLALVGGIDRERIGVLRRITQGIPIGHQVIYLLTEYTSIFLRR